MGVTITPRATLTSKHSTISMTYNDEMLIVNVLINVAGRTRTIRVSEYVLQNLITKVIALKEQAAIKDSEIIKLSYFVSAANKECDTGLMVALNLVKAIIYNGTDMVIALPTSKKAKKNIKDKEIILGSEEYLNSLDLAAFATSPAPSSSSKAKTPKKLLLEEKQLEILERDAQLLEDMDKNMLKYLEDM